jgi:predicted HicB family RNase H-like nuclease
MAEVIRTFLRIPKDLHEDLLQWAHEEDRSMNSLIVHVLRRAVKEWRRAA